MNKKILYSGLAVVLLSGALLAGINGLKGNAAKGTESVSAATVDPASILTTTALRKLPPLKETDVIKPTGKVKAFTLNIAEGKWELVKGTTVDAITVNGTIPGPQIRVTEGDTVRVTVKNNLKEETSIHWHGLHVPNEMDGVPPFTQKPIKPGESFTYEFIANHAGTFMYHSHLNSVKQIDKGLYGPFIIDPQNAAGQPKFDQDITWMLGGWNVDESKEGSMEDMKEGSMEDMKEGSAVGMTEGSMEGMQGGNMDYNYWTINGKSFPDTQAIKAKKGQKIRVRLINISNAPHPMHLHGQDFRVIAEDGHPIAQPQVMNTIDVAPGKTYDIEFIADNPGTWVFHCHELHHTMNGEVEPGGLIGAIQISK
ncbi:multicopper oxidase family protein [uncultured Paenibacillus sp.]|uniref:multicopper oxidase family protein n=1 Tax=uncultured Paenibacillus sp. TaxID=227322 RepID=UPI0028D10C50|nr:multicopper oxidase family protein [uncultured Paenibacillus sp.]